MADFYETLEKSAAPQKGPRPLQAAPVPPPNGAYSELMKRAEAMAERIAKSGTGERLSVEQCFEKVFSAPENRELAMAALGKGKRPTAAGRFPPKGKAGISFDQDGSAGDPNEADDDVENDDANNDAGDANAAPSAQRGVSGYGGTDWRNTDPNRKPNTGKSPATYLSSGANMNQVPRNAAIGATEGSYNDKARPKSALRKIQKRIRKALKRQVAAG